MKDKAESRKLKAEKRGEAGKIPVLLRVFNRLDDLRENVRIIQSEWKRGEYPIQVAFNGRSAGYEIPVEVAESATIIEFPENLGHKAGALNLLVQGLLSLPEQYEYAVTLEADTWVLDDRIVQKYLDLMRRDPRVVWAAGNWVDKHHSLAIDFAIVRLAFAREHHSLITFTDGIESRLYSAIDRLGLRSLLIEEANPTHLPKAMPFAVQASGRRRRAFPRVPMVTHHVEDLAGGIDEKKQIANRTAGRMIFADSSAKSAKSAVLLSRLGYLAYEWLLKVTPKSRWIKGRRLKQ